MLKYVALVAILSVFTYACCLDVADPINEPQEPCPAPCEPMGLVHDITVPVPIDPPVPIDVPVPISVKG